MQSKGQQNMAKIGIGFDTIRLSFDEKTKLIENDSELTIKDIVIAREIVQQYEDGKAYKPAEELEKAAFTADGRWIIPLEHPATGLLVRREDISGKMSNVRFVKDLLDEKTKRPMIRGIRADATWYKDKTPKTVIDALHNRTMSDVSIGFTYEEDRTPGTWNGDSYDFVQRNIFIDHLCAPTEVGRCPSPLCGIGADAAIKQKANALPDSEKPCPIKAKLNELSAEGFVKLMKERFTAEELSRLLEPAAPMPTTAAHASQESQSGQAASNIEQAGAGKAVSIPAQGAATATAAVAAAAPSSHAIAGVGIGAGATVSLPQPLPSTAELLEKGKEIMERAKQLNHHL